MAYAHHLCHATHGEVWTDRDFDRPCTVPRGGFAGERPKNPALALLLFERVR
jgi:hypothetical protein